MNNKYDYTPTVLVVEDEAYSRKFLKNILTESGCQYIGMASIKEGRAYLAKADLPDLILLDIRLPDGSGLDFFGWICTQELPVPVILMTAHGSIEEAVVAMKGGAYDFITKPFDDLGKIRLSLKNALEHGRLKTENLMLRAKLNSPRVFQEIIGKSKEMEKVFFLIQKAAQTKSNVLIEGGSGTGKELVAKAIHDLSDRKRQPFIPVNCGALPENLLESALFGHEKGAFTGADKMNKGFFEEADGGTLFLDEIGDAPLSVQVKILRAVEYGTIYRVGSTKPIAIDVRFLSATHKDLKVEIDEARFREDLFYRINVINIFLPSLEKRRSDIPVLLQHFANKICLDLGVEEKVFTSEVISFLRNRPWPGNVRELKNFIERVVALHSGKEVNLEEVTAMCARSLSGNEGSLYDIDFEQARSNFEKIYFQKLIDACHGDLALAVETSGVHKTTIYRKLKDHKIKPN